MRLVDGGRYKTVGADRAANLNWFNDRPKLNDNWTDNANPNFGSLVADSLLSSAKMSYPAAKHFSNLLELSLQCQILINRQRLCIFCQSQQDLEQIQAAANLAQEDNLITRQWQGKQDSKHFECCLINPLTERISLSFGEPCNDLTYLEIKVVQLNEDGSIQHKITRCVCVCV